MEQTFTGPLANLWSDSFLIAQNQLHNNGYYEGWLEPPALINTQDDIPQASLQPI